MIKENQLLEIRGDRIFHDMFNEYEMDTIEWLVMKILDCKYEDIHGKVIVGGTESPNLSKDDKRKRLDLVVYYKDKILNIELNNNAGSDYLRNACYIGNRVINSYLEGDDYDKVTQGILVNLNWYTESEKKKHPERKVEEIWKYPTLKKDDNIPKYFIKFIHINLCIFKDICYNEVESDDLVWKLFTITDREELNDLVKKEKLLKNYCNKITRLSKDKEYCRMIWDDRLEENLRKHDDYNNGKYEGIDIGFEQGVEQGIEQKQNEMIINFYNNKVPIDIISKSSGLSIKEIEKIIENNDK